MEDIVIGFTDGAVVLSLAFGEPRQDCLVCKLGLPQTPHSIIGLSLLLVDQMLSPPGTFADLSGGDRQDSTPRVLRTQWRGGNKGCALCQEGVR